MDKLDYKKAYKELYQPKNEPRLIAFSEGLCVQCMHIGSFDEEPATLENMKRYIEGNGLVSDLSATRRHHEIYLSNPRKTAIPKMKTVLRYPVKAKGL
jgi:hypothetical protein